MKLETIACLASAKLAGPAALVGLPIITLIGVWWLGAEIPLLVISILALTFSQLVLMSTAKDTRALQAKLDEVLRALPDASNDLIGVEKRA